MTPAYSCAQYGCGLSAPEDWINFDASPTLRIQRTPLLNLVLRPKPVFPANVRYGDIVRGLPLAAGSLDGVYCSHILEHLSLFDCRTALRNTYKLLKPGGYFRMVLPDLEYCARKYLSALEGGNKEAALQFMAYDTMLGQENRPRGFNGTIRSFWGNSNHLWFWDYESLSVEHAKAGFTQIRRCQFNDGPGWFKSVEELSRFTDNLAIECRK